MHMGGMKFKQRGREEQAEADGTEVITNNNLIRILVLLKNNIFRSSLIGRWSCSKIVGCRLRRFIQKLVKTKNQSRK